MVHGVLADVVVVVHLVFIVFVGVGGLVAWRWPWVLWLHVPCVVWCMAIITVGFTCPLTPLEKTLRRLAGGKGYGGGFVNRYIEGVVYPESLTPLLRGLAAVTVVVGYAGLRWRRRAAHRVSISQLA
jgi:hypothetical protein